MAQTRTQGRPETRAPLLTGQTAVVSGASSGIGAATAAEVARRGARVVLAARRADLLDTQVRAITEAGGQALAVPTDVTDAAQVAHLVARAREAFGPIGILVNNAGVLWHTQVARTSADDMAHLVETNLLGAILLTRAVLPEMLARHHGAIVSVSSLAGRVAVEPLYSATKFGVRGFSFALRRQVAGSGVSVSVVSPGNIRTAMTADLPKRLPGPERVAEAIADLLVRPRREVIVPRQHYVLAWMDQMLPTVVDQVSHWRHWSRAV